MSFNLRKRLISPGACFDEDLADLSDLHWRVFVSLPMIADRAGFLEDRPRRIKAAVLPMHDCSVNEVSVILDDLAKVGKITRDGGIIRIIGGDDWFPGVAATRDSRASWTKPERDYIAIILHDPCAFCGAPSEQIDHIEPYSVVGGGDPNNLTPACASCNNSKGTRSVLRFMLAVA